MLHIILGILKIVGIIFGVLLLLLFLMILGLLFVPVRYSISAVSGEEKSNIQIGISWLLHIVSVKLNAGLDRSVQFSIYLFGLRLPFPRKKKEMQKDSPVELSISESEDKQIESEMAEAEPSVFVEQERIEKIEEKEDAREKEDAKVSEDLKVSEDSKEADDPQASEDQKDSDGPKESATVQKEKKSLSKKLSDFYNKIIGLLQTIFHKIQTLFQKVSSFPDRVELVSEKIETLTSKPGEWLGMAEEYQAKELIVEILQKLKYLLKHYGIRKITGYLTFGTGDPASTGQLTGILYLIMPSNASKFVLTPEFNEKTLRTKIYLKGHIRAIHVLRVGWQCFRDKKVRKIIKFIRNRK